MSTAGKVLVAFVTLLLVGWLIMMSMVAQLNSNWGKVIADQTTRLASLEQEIQTVRADLAAAKSKLGREQVAFDHDLVVVRTEISDRERALTDTIEALERANNQVEEQGASLKFAETGRTRRRDEGAEAEKALAETRQEVERLTASNGEQMDRLARLRKEFIDLLQENRRLVGRKVGARDAE